LLLYAYDAAPRALKELGLGELAAFLVWGPYGLGVASILIGRHIDQRRFDTAPHQRTLPVLLGERRARALNRTVVVGMHAVCAVAVAVEAFTPYVAVVLLAAPRALRALRVMARPAPEGPPPGYVGWPLWYHRVCLVHNRAFGWLLLGGLALGAI
jgi:1,4-dihydroxy-2-naphthoate polyprenyltransferase